MSTENALHDQDLLRLDHSIPTEDPMQLKEESLLENIAALQEILIPLKGTQFYEFFIEELAKYERLLEELRNYR